MGKYFFLCVDKKNIKINLKTNLSVPESYYITLKTSGLAIGSSSYFKFGEITFGKFI